MTDMLGASGREDAGVARLRDIRIANYRVLRDVEFRELTPLTVVFGPNGSGKSTLLDALLLVHDAFTMNLASAVALRGGIGDLRSRGSEGPVVVQFAFDDGQDELTYRIDIEEAVERDNGDGGDVVVRREVVTVRSAGAERPRTLLDVSRGIGFVVNDTDGLAESSQQERLQLDSPDLLAADVLGQLGHRPVARVRRFVNSWRHTVVGMPRQEPAARVVPRLRGQPTPWMDPSGRLAADFLASLQDDDPEAAADIVRVARRWIPQLDDISAERGNDGHYSLWLRDRAFEQPIPEAFMSDGTRRLVALLLQLRAGHGPLLLLAEEPELLLHPKLHGPVAEELGQVARRGGVIATTHSPYFADALRPEELWLIHRGADGYAQLRRAAEDPRVTAMVEAGGLLGDLWMEGWFGAGDPVRRAEEPRP